MESGMFDYEEWLDEVSNKGLVDEQNENENVSVECSVGNHSTCTRGICQCVCHLSTVRKSSGFEAFRAKYGNPEETIDV